MNEILKEYGVKMQKTVDVVISDFAAVRAGRANAAVLDKITVDYYGSPTPVSYTHLPRPGGDHPRRHASPCGGPDRHRHQRHPRRGGRRPYRGHGVYLRPLQLDSNG